MRVLVPGGRRRRDGRPAADAELAAPLAGPAGGLDDLLDVVAQFGQGDLHLVGEDVAEVGEGARLAAGELVHAAHQLDELARVDVRVAPVLDVRDQRLGDARAVVVDGRRRRVDRLEGLGELLPGGGGKGSV